MDIFETMRARHSVRAYNGGSMSADEAAQLNALIADCNAEGGLNMQLRLNEPEVFKGIMASYGSFSGVNDYIAMVGARSDGLEERVGYYGERVVLKAAELGLGTCWVAVTYSKGKVKCDMAAGEKLVCVVSIGHADNMGRPRKSKSIGELCRVSGEMPEWFRRGMEAAALAPTAMNQQKFLFTLNGNTVSVKMGVGMYTQLDLGIVKCHFELGAGEAGWQWAQM